MAVALQYQVAVDSGGPSRGTVLPGFTGANALFTPFNSSNSSSIPLYDIHPNIVVIFLNVILPTNAGVYDVTVTGKLIIVTGNVCIVLDSFL